VAIPADWVDLDGQAQLAGTRLGLAVGAARTAPSATSPPTQDVTVMGRPDTGLLVVADFDTPAARAVGLITAHRRHGRPSTAWSGTPRT
jgi:hypothetical protein